MLAILAALDAELSSVRTLTHAVEVSSEASSTIYEGSFRGKSVLLIKTGIGRQRAEVAAKRLIERYPVTHMLSVGFAGGLSETLRGGEVVLCTSQRNSENPLPGRSRWLPNPLSGGDGVHPVDRDLWVEGSCVTSPTLLTAPNEKRRLGEASGALIVDMESYWIAGIAQEAEIPCSVLRAVSDRMNDRVPPFDLWMTTDGHWRITSACAHFIRKPQDLAALFRLACNGVRARKRLRAAIAAWLDLVVPLGDER